MKRDKHIARAEALLVAADRALYDGATQRATVLTAMADVHARLASVVEKNSVTVPPAHREPLNIGDYPG